MKSNKNHFLILLMLSFWGQAFCQEIGIPYRVGTKWGICNEEGKIILEPKYDSLDFSGYDTNQDVLTPKINNKEGVIIAGKVLFEPVYDHIYCSNNLYFTTKFENNSKISDVFDAEGKSILKNPVIDVLSNKKVTDRIYTFHLLNKDYTETFFFYDIVNKKIIQTIYENYASINFIRRQSDYFSTSFLVKKNANDPLITEAWDVTKLPNTITKTKLLYRTEKEYLEKFLKYSRRQNSSGDYSGSGSGSLRMETDDNVVVKGDYNDIAVEAPREENRQVNKTVSISYNLNIKNNKLVLSTYNQNQNKPLPDVLIDLKVPTQNIELKNQSFNLKRNDTISYFQNYVQFKNKDKYALIFPSNLKKIIEFDTIAKNSNSISDNNNNRDVILLVGNKDKKTNQFKYSLYSNQKGLLFPMQYDNLTYAKKLYANNGNSNYYSKIGDKLGILQIDGTEFLKAEYDEINENNRYESYGAIKKVLDIKKDNKFGIVYQNPQTYKLELIDAIFDYEIKNIYLNFPKINYPKGNDSKGISKKITLISLKDKRGNIVGYANANGMLYFKN
ncbi:MAG: hypothetical protein WCJ62_01530 [Flavobacterium sp.]